LICHLIGNFTPDAQGVAGGGGGRRTGEFLGMKIALLVLLLLVGCSQKPSGPAAGSQAATRDASAVESLAEKDKCFPALEWLKNTSTNMLWKGDRAAILKHFEEQHKAGMTEITAVGVETMEGKQICASFVALLPPPGPARDKAIRLHNDFWKAYLGPDVSAEDLADFQVKDEGQKYLDYNFDL